ncbi:MAG: DNA polymerase III subunit delta [Rikenellaceae bacterium]|nr:DNA polymerase III subunit delta [Rikenellaceae bacterium]MDE7355904.1 DNA polymerase III subunit delta [Rikenellaceae bacterium]
MAKKAVKSTGNFKSTLESYSAVMKELRGGIYRSVYLLMGQEPFFIDKVSDYIENKILPEEAKGFNLQVVYGGETTPGEIIQRCRTYPMMPGHNIVIVRDAAALKGIEQLAGYFNAPMERCILVLLYKGGSVDKRSAFFKMCADKGRVVESTAPRDYETGPWLKEMLASQGYSIDERAAAMLTDNLGTSLQKIEQEVTKLTTRLSPDHKTITVNDIEDNIGISKEFNNFELTRALSEGDMAKALIICDHFARNPKENPLVVTLQMLFTHFQRLFTLGIMIWNARNKRMPIPNDNEMMAALKFSSLYFLKEYKNALARYPTRKSFLAMGAIREYDLKSKGFNTSGSISDGDLLKELVLKIMAF